MKKLIPMFMVAAALGAAVPALKWEHDLEAAKKRAKAEHKVIFMDVWTEWCGWCIRLQKNTFPTPQAQAALAKVIPLSVKTQLKDGSPTEHKAIEAQYNVDGFPALLILDADGKVLDRHPGYLAAEPFADWINKAAKK